MKAQHRTGIEALAATVALGVGVGVGACGGGSKSTTSTSKPAAASTGAKPVAPAAKFHAVLTGQDHAPIATKPWHYTVRVTSLSGRPLAGTVETEFAFGGQVVGRETPPTHSLQNGLLIDHVTFPQQAVGQPLEVQVVVRTSAGSQTLDWPVHVKP